MAFEFATATRVVFGPGTARGAGTLAAGSMKANPVDLTASEIIGVLEAAW